MSKLIFHLFIHSLLWESLIVHCPYTWGFSQFPIDINNAFIIMLVKMWLGGAPHVVVETLKVSLDRHFSFCKEGV